MAMECEFDMALKLLSADVIRMCYLQRPKMFDWYYGDFLYTNVKFIAIIESHIENPKWQYPYAFWSLSMGPIIQSRHFFKLRYWNGFYVVFENLEATPFEGDLGEQIEYMLRDDDGTQTPMQLVRDICTTTGVLITPQFVTLSRKVRVMEYGDNLWDGTVYSPLKNNDFRN